MIVAIDTLCVFVAPFFQGAKTFSKQFKAARTIRSCQSIISWVTDETIVENGTKCYMYTATVLKNENSKVSNNR